LFKQHMNQKSGMGQSTAVASAWRTHASRSIVQPSIVA
jgi:hypothetical protein